MRGLERIQRAWGRRAGICSRKGGRGGVTWSMGRREKREREKEKWEKREGAYSWKWEAYTLMDKLRKAMDGLYISNFNFFFFDIGLA